MSPTTLQSLATVDAPDAGVMALPDDLVRMAEGRLARDQTYTTVRFVVEVQLTMPDQLFDVELPEFLGFTTDPSDPINRPGIVFVSAESTEQLVPPVLSAQDLQASANQHARSLPPDIAAWLEANPYLNVSNRQETTVGGRPAVVYDYRVSGLPDAPVTCGETKCMILFYVAGSIFHALPDSKVGRVFVVDVGADTILIDYGGPEDQLASFAPAFETLIASAQFG